MIVHSLMADCVRKIFKNIKFSDNGSNAREREEKTYMMFLDYLDECEKGMSKRTDFCMLHFFCLENYADINFSEYGQDTEKSNDELQSEESVDKRGLLIIKYELIIHYCCHASL